MTNLQSLLGELLIWVQFLAALTALRYWPKLKNSYWKWFIVYLCVIFFVEAFSKWGLTNAPGKREILYSYFGIPVQFLFFYWLYASKSLGNNKLFWTCILLYCISFLPHFIIFGQKTIIQSLSYTVGNMLLMILVLLEIFQQIKSEKILLFRSNFMFYVNIGILVFYIGTLPFFSFYGLILKDKDLWSNYYTFFMVSNNIMYLLFICAFLWGKPNTY